MDKISVIIPAYNAEKTILRCINSILNGNGRNTLYLLEIIVIDDGSSDNTADIVKEIVKLDSDVILHLQKNKGPSAARYAGVQIATGNYIAHCDSDDWVEPNWLESLYSTIKEYDADISICRAIIDGHPVNYNPQEVEIWNHEQAIGKFIEHKELNGCLPMKLIKYEYFKNILFEPKMSIYEDGLIIWQILQKTQKVVKRNIGTYHYEMISNSLTHIKQNEKRLWSAYYLWDRVVFDCQNNISIKNFQNKAIERRESCIIDELSLMVTQNLKSDYYFNKIRKTIINGGVKGILKLPNWKKRFLSIGAIISIPFMQKTYKFLNY